MSKYPAKTHARNTLSYYRSLAAAAAAAANATGTSSSSEKPLFALTAPSLTLYPHCDQSQPFRQDRYFNYLTGAHDLPAAAVLYNSAADRLTLYLPPIDADDVMWSGLPLSPTQAQEKYDMDVVKYHADLAADVASTNVLTIDDRNKSVLESLLSSSNVTISPTFKEALEEARLRKDEFELALMRKASAISDVSHRAVMSALPIETNEGHIHAEFVYHSMRQGSKFQSYDPICCSGTDCGTLHYVRNDQEMADKQLVLIDAGAEWQCYASDVTRVFPITGEWTPEALAIYKAVLDMQTQSMEGVKPGVKWDDLHLLSHRILIKHFLELGIFKNTKSPEEILEARTSVGFLPHGLGHLLGMDTHDVAGHPNYEDPDPMFRYLRLRRPLEPGFVVTVEPGIYFNKFLLEPYLKDPKHLEIINTEVLEKYWAVGGVRLEDDVLVTETGFENFTKVTTDPEEVARIVKEGIAKGRSHFHVLA
ncbi:uncharacterized protein SAPINGB_P003797 [Magnusiomyces paraingens]|uniref:Aminopeptidase P N-terminal domain-containing protein n=1 Tax=Magnusiomyces paraingens TaxID=2606893 RepID=A0A5E8BS76_9ASCO|nr:uncharacterized protein SAPINGB_P003797 [Saprochaete ingens]VVT53881.1 unnamed protein product [Saprochaete ingens]